MFHLGLRTGSQKEGGPKIDRARGGTTLVRIQKRFNGRVRLVAGGRGSDVWDRLGAERAGSKGSAMRGNHSGEVSKGVHACEEDIECPPLRYRVLEG